MQSADNVHDKLSHWTMSVDKIEYFLIKIATRCAIDSLVDASRSS